MHTVLNGKSKEVIIGIDRPFVMIGEKINPTGHKKLAAALTENNFEYVRHLVTRQIAWGADVLDVNVGVPGLDEVGMMAKIIELVCELADVPVCIDSGDPAVLEAGLMAAPGKPLVNSISGEEKRLQTVLPLVKDRGAAVIALTMDDNGIPSSAEKRLEVAEKIIERAVQAGIPVEDIIVDPLVLTVGSDSQAALVTLQTVKLLREKLGVNINLGASNISFGLPERPLINSTFLTMAIQAGATCSITDPAKLGMSARISDLLLGRDPDCLRYLRFYRAAEKLRASEDISKPVR